MKIIRINKDGSMNDLEIKLKKKSILTQLEKISISKGDGCISELYKWSYEGKTILCYGWYDGDPGFENKHELIPGGSSKFLDEDSSEKLLFGDLFLICCDCKGSFIEYSVSDYAEYYNIVFDGFDSCSDDSSEENEGDIQNDDGLNDFIDNDNEDNNSDSSFEYLSNEELDVDENEY